MSSGQEIDLQLIGPSRGNGNETLTQTSTTRLTQVGVTLTDSCEARTLLCIALCLAATARKPVETC